MLLISLLALGYKASRIRKIMGLSGNPAVKMKAVDFLYGDGDGDIDGDDLKELTSDVAEDLKELTPDVVDDLKELTSNVAEFLSTFF